MQEALEDYQPVFWTQRVKRGSRSQTGLDRAFPFLHHQKSALSVKNSEKAQTYELHLSGHVRILHAWCHWKRVPQFWTSPATAWEPDRGTSLPPPSASCILFLNTQARKTVLQARQSFIKNEFWLKRGFKSFCNDDWIIRITLHYATENKPAHSKGWKCCLQQNHNFVGSSQFQCSPARFRWDQVHFVHARKAKSCTNLVWCSSCRAEVVLPHSFQPKVLFQRNTDAKCFRKHS